MFTFILALLSIGFIYFDYYRKKNIGRTILLSLAFILALYILFRLSRLFRYGLLCALILLPAYYYLSKGKKKK